MSAARKKGKKSSGDADSGSLSEPLQECDTILKFLIAKPESEPFNTPVDWEFYGLTDYPEVIKKPMDLGTIKTKLEGGKYADAAKFGADVRLVWSNAMTYNRPGSEIYITADKLSKLFERKFTKVKGGAAASTSSSSSSSATTTTKAAATPTTKRKRTEGGSAESKEVTREDRIKFTQLVNQLSGDELGQLVDIIQKECPDALNEEDEKEIEIEINNIDAGTLMMLNDFAQKCVSQQADKKASTAAAKKAKT